MKPIYIYFVPFFPSETSWRGGFFYDAVKALMRDGRFNIKVFSTAVRYDYRIDGVDVYGVGSCKIGSTDYFSTITDYIKILLFEKKLYELGLSPKMVSVCHVHLLDRMAIYAHWIKKQNKNCLTLIHHHLSGEKFPKKNKLSWLFPFEKEFAHIRKRRSYISADAHIFCSREAQLNFGKYFLEGSFSSLIEGCHFLKCSKFLKPLSYKKSRIVYNGIDSELFYEDYSQRTDDVYKIGCVANFIRSKGQIVLIEAFAKVAINMPNAILVFVGTGEMLSACKKKVQELNLCKKIFFIKEYEHKKIAKFYQSLNLYVLPSWWEAFNCSLIEAYSCGVPVITTNTISFKEVLHKEDHKIWLVPDNNSDALADSILRAYSNRTHRQRLTANLDINNVSKDFLNWVENFKQRGVY